MRSLEARFNIVTKKHPEWSSYICFAGAVIGQNFSKQVIRRWFIKLVNTGDYAKSEKQEILTHLENLHKTRVHDQNSAKLVI